MNTRNTKTSDQVGMSIARALRDQAEQLDPAVEARLRSARALAVQAAQEARAPELALQTAIAGAGVGASKPIRWGGRWGSLLPAAVLALGLVALAHSQWLQQTLGLAERDASVLRDSLPPNAYGDPGFNEYLDEKTGSETPPPDEDEAKP